MGILYNQKKQNLKRKMLRDNCPEAERILWSYLKGKQILGYKFRRQFSIGTYVLDFYCPSLKLAIEVDGEYHNTKNQKEIDLERQKVIEEYNIIFLRFKNYEIFTNIIGVIKKIKNKVIELRQKPIISPLLTKEGI